MKINNEKLSLNVKELIELYYDKPFKFDQRLADILPNIENYPFLNILGLREYLQSNNKKEYAGSFHIESNLLFFRIEDEIFKVGVSVDKPQLSANSLNEKLLETNFAELWMQKYKSDVEAFVLTRLHSRYQVRTNIEFLKDLLKCRWAQKPYLKKILIGIISKYGITNKEFKLKSGKTKIGVAPACEMIHMSTKASVGSKCSWKKSFPEEYKEKDLFMQGGESGLVLSKSGNYSTAFVEVFPSILLDNGKIFSTFIRGEGSTIIEAELSAYTQLLEAKNCKHEWVRFRDRDNGQGQCIHCRVFHSKALPPSTLCDSCEVPTTGIVNNNKHYCLAHYMELSMNQIKYKSEGRSLIDYKSRVTSNFTFESKGITGKANLKQLYRKISNSNYSKNNRSYYIDMAFNHPKMTFYIKQKLYKMGMLNEQNYSDHKFNMKIYKLAFTLNTQFSILYNKDSRMSELTQAIDELINDYF